MPALPNAVLRAKLRAALPGAVFETGPEQIHPAVLTLPRLGRLRVYLWTLTADRSAAGARPVGEFKIHTSDGESDRRAARCLIVLPIKRTVPD